MFYENETGPITEAHYTNKGARKPATLDIAVRTVASRAWTHIGIPVEGKRHARQVAAAHNAIPWNF